MFLFWSSDALLLPLQAEEQLRYVCELLQVTVVVVMADAAGLLDHMVQLLLRFSFWIISCEEVCCL